MNFSNILNLDIRYRICIFIIFCIIISILNFTAIISCYEFYSYFLFIAIFVPTYIMSRYLFNYSERVNKYSNVSKFEKLFGLILIPHFIIIFIFLFFVEDGYFFRDINNRYYLLFYFIFSSSMYPLTTNTITILDRKKIKLFIAFGALLLFSSKNMIYSFIYSRSAGGGIAEKKLINLVGEENKISIQIILLSFSLYIFSLLLSIFLDNTFFVKKTRLELKSMGNIGGNND